MAVTNFSPLLGLALPTTGDLSGTWGTTVNDAITSLIDSAVAGTTTLSADADVTLSTTNGAANQARNAVILWTASNGATTRNITAPAQSKAYLVINAGTGSIVVRGSGPTAGVTVASGVRALVAWNGSDFVKIVSNPVVLTTDVSGTLPIANGGTGTTSTTFTNLATNVTGTLPVANGGTSLTILTANNVILGNGTSAPTFVAPSTSGNVLTSNGTTWQSSTPASGFSTAANNTFTGTQTFNGTSSIFGTVLLDSAETVNVVAAAPSSTTNFYVQSGSVQYYTSNAANNWTLNVAFSSGTSMNTALAIGQSVTFVLIGRAHV